MYDKNIKRKHIFQMWWFIRRTNNRSFFVFFPNHTEACTADKVDIDR